MAKSSSYTARASDARGYVQYPANEHHIWYKLYTQQKALLPGRACQEYLNGIDMLGLPKDQIPQLPDVNRVLEATTGWRTEAVPALISFDKFFALLASKRFPVATFIRREEELEYLQEPDIFHEIFGHCPLLTHPSFAHFTHKYGQLGAQASKEDRVFLARLYWFTVEFGLLRTNGVDSKGVSIYGGGILSSPGETHYALESAEPEHREFDLVDVLRTPYRIDIMQPIYYVLNSIEQLFEIADSDIPGAIAQAKRLGLFEPRFPPKTPAMGQLAV